MYGKKAFEFTKFQKKKYSPFVQSASVFGWLKDKGNSPDTKLLDTHLLSSNISKTLDTGTLHLS